MALQKIMQDKSGFIACLTSMNIEQRLVAPEDHLLPHPIEETEVES